MKTKSGINESKGSIEISGAASSNKASSMVTKARMGDVKHQASAHLVNIKSRKNEQQTRSRNARGLARRRHHLYGSSGMPSGGVSLKIKHGSNAHRSGIFTQERRLRQCGCGIACYGGVTRDVMARRCGGMPRHQRRSVAYIKLGI